MVRLIRPLLLNPFVRHDLRRYLSTPNRADLLALQALIESGQLKAVIDRTYPLRETARALGHVAAGHARGRVVVIIPRV